MVAADITSHLVMAVLACVIGSGFQHGYNTGVTNAPQKILEEFFNVSQTNRGYESGFSIDQLTMVWSIAVSIFCVGGMVGAMMTAFMSERFGRKKSLQLNNIFVLVAATLLGFSYFAKSYEMIIVGRFIIGINAGLNAGLAPMYLTEISPMALRGAIGSTYQVVITLSIFLSQVFGLPQCLGTPTLWPILFALIVIPAVFQVISLMYCPESPKYTLLHRKDERKSEEALKWLRQVEDVSVEMQQIRSELETMDHVAKTTLKDLLKNSSLRKPLLICIVLMLAQQLSGINSVIAYSTDIFNSAGLKPSVAMIATMVMGLINVIMTVISMWLVEKAGRRILFIVGLAALIIITVLLTICLLFKDQYVFFSYFALVLVYVFIVFFASGIGSIPWFIVSEMFDQSARSVAASVAIAVNWLASFLVMLLFLPLKKLLGDYVFLVFTAFLTIFLVFTIKFVPETKNRPIEEIQALFERKKSLPNYRSNQQLTAKGD